MTKDESPAGTGATARTEDATGTGDAAAREERATREALERLARALEEQQRRDAYRWVWVAGFGIVTVAVSTLLLRWVQPGPAGTIGRAGLPAPVWVGVAVMAVALAVALVWPNSEVVGDPLGVLAGAVIVGIGVVDPLHGASLGPAPWLALTGAVVAASAAIGRLIALAAARRSRPSNR
jgi:hypothetical protein